MLFRNLPSLLQGDAKETFIWKHYLISLPLSPTVGLKKKELKLERETDRGSEGK